MKNLLDKIFFRNNNLENISERIKDLSNTKQCTKIFNCINSYSDKSEIRFVGGCIRKILNNEQVDDIDLATNLEPNEVSEVLKSNQINFYETGIEHGTITAVIDEKKFEITSLREDIFTDGRHAKVKFSKDWKKDALRRDFTINSIYSDREGNIFDPFNGKKDLEEGCVNFIGDGEKRIKEDYLRILRYLRFFSTYSKKKHDPETLKIIKRNIEGISRLSKERLLEELKKILNPKILIKISKDKQTLDLIKTIFPELIYIDNFSKINSQAKNFLNELDFLFLLSTMIIDKTDNVEYFLFKYNLSKKDQNRIKIISDFYKDLASFKSLTEKNMNKILYYHGKQAVLDILLFNLFRSKKINQNITDLIKLYESKKIPVMPIKADLLMAKYKLKEGKNLGNKLKLMEKEWVDNDFQITDQQIKNIVND
tara:strand:+ start:35 stop:1309 length:1275 start_codon:yes stop_codon:yes gene_type:complete